MEYELKRSRRRTVSIEINKDGRLLVRAPMRLPKYEVERFIEEKRRWIDKHLLRARLRNDRAREVKPIDENEIKRLKKAAKDVIPGKVANFADVIGVSYGRISIRNQKTLWGSCSAKGNLNFNCLLMKAPEHVLDYVIVHELCHRREMNHSAAFWRLVASVIPDHKACRKWLTEEGALYLTCIRD